MATNELDVRISLKRDSASNWSTKNPKLLDGELVVVNDTAGPRLKVGDGNSNYSTIPFLDAAATSHIENKSNPHGVTKAQVGLGNVDNTADSAKTVKAAGALTVVSKGSATQPVYFNANGVPVACTYSLGKSVPSDAVFTDTVYTHPSYTAKSSGLYKITVDSLGHVSGATAVAKSDITGLGIPAQDTVYTHPSHTAKSSGLYKITVDSLGHVSAATAVAKSDITALGIPAQDTVYTHPSSHAASMITGLATVATSGSYSDLSNKPSIPAVTKVTFTASDSKWGSLSNGRYPLTISASGGEFLNCYRTNGSNYDKMDVNVTVSGNNIIIYSLDKFAGYVTYIK